MKKYKTLNFFDEYNNKYKYINKLALLGILVFIFLNLSVNIVKLKKLESDTIYHKAENVVSNEAEDIQEKSIDLNQIKSIYSLFGTSNINEMIILKDDVQIQGKCTDLNILDNIKSMETVKNPSVDSISKEGDYYMFRLKYQTR